MAEGDTRVKIHRFFQGDGKVGRGAVTYMRDGDEADSFVEILDFQVLAEVPSDQLKVTVAGVDDRGSSELTLKKPSYTKFNNAFKIAVDDVMEKLGGESSSSSNEDEKSEDDESEEEKKE